MNRGRPALVRLAMLCLVYLDSEKSDLGSPRDEAPAINRVETVRMNLRSLAEKIISKYGDNV